MGHTRQNWSSAETELIAKYYGNTWSYHTLYLKIHAINSTRTSDSLTRELRRWQERGWEKSKDAALRSLRVGYFDIECTNLKADVGYILTWCIKPAGQKRTICKAISKEDIFSGTLDKRIVKELLEVINDQFDLLYTQYGWKFDLPYTKTRVFKHNLQRLWPSKGQVLIRDLWMAARTHLALHSNRLQSIADVVNINQVKKTNFDTGIWQKAALGNQKCLNKIRNHNIIDVELLELTSNKIEEIITIPHRFM